MDPDRLLLKAKDGTTLLLYAPDIGPDQISASAFLVEAPFFRAKTFRNGNIRVKAPALKERKLYFGDLTLPRVQK